MAVLATAGNERHRLGDLWGVLKAMGGTGLGVEVPAEPVSPHPPLQQGLLTQPRAYPVTGRFEI